MIMRNLKPSVSIARSRAAIHLCFLASFIAVSLNMYLANNIPKIEPAHIPRLHVTDAIVIASQADLYAFIRAKPDPRQKAIEGMSIAWVIMRTTKSTSGPKNLFSLNQSRKRNAMSFVLSGLTQKYKMTPRIAASNRNRTNHTYQGVFFFSSSESLSYSAPIGGFSSNVAYLDGKLFRCTICSASSTTLSHS